MMLHIADVLSSEQVRVLRQSIDAAPWGYGRVSVGEQGARVKRNRQLPAEHPLAVQAGATVVAALQASTHFFAAALPLRIGRPLFSRYEGGQAYGLHVDGAARLEPSGWLRTDLSCTVFLSDPQDYEGGELEVVDTYGSHTVKLPAGDAILYPSSSLHQVLTVTQGLRVASVLWLQSMVRDDAQRRQIYELDQSIQSLRLKYGDGPELLTLTNHYHNLLRQWSEM